MKYIREHIRHVTSFLKGGEGGGETCRLLLRDRYLQVSLPRLRRLFKLSEFTFSGRMASAGPHSIRKGHVRNEYFENLIFFNQRNNRRFIMKKAM